MKWIFIILGFFTGYYGSVGLVAAITHHLPYSLKLSKTHEVAKAQRVDGKLDIWYGPIPYGRIFFGPVTFFFVFLLVCGIIALFIPSQIKPFGIGVGISLVVDLLGLHDPSGRFKRDFNLTLGDNYISNLDHEDVYNLKDEQIYLDEKQK